MQAIPNPHAKPWSWRAIRKVGRSIKAAHQKFYRVLVLVFLFGLLIDASVDELKHMSLGFWSWGERIGPTIHFLTLLLTFYIMYGLVQFISKAVIAGAGEEFQEFVASSTAGLDGWMNTRNAKARDNLALLEYRYRSG